MSETNIADFLSKTISNFELDESLWDSNISNHFISREKDYFGREKLDSETIIEYLQEQSKELKMKVVLIGTEDFNWTILGRPGLIKMWAIPSGLPNCLLNGTMEEIQEKRKIYEFCDLQYQSFGSVHLGWKDKRSLRHVLNIPWIILHRETNNLPEYCIVPISKLRDMSREQYFILLHFVNELQIITKEAISSNEALNQPKVLKMAVPMQEDILENDNLKIHGEKRKMPLEDGQENPAAQPSKKIKLEDGYNEERASMFSLVIDDSMDYHCPVCSTRILAADSSKGIPKAGFQMRFKYLGKYN